MELVLGIDLGTSYFKLGLFDREGRLRGLGRVAVETDTGDGSRCEFPIVRFRATLRRGLSQALEQAGEPPQSICGAAYSSQANSFVLLDENAHALTPLILWPDSRADENDPALDRLWSRPDALSITGQGLSGGREFALTKLRWFQTHQPDIWARVRRIMTISDYLVFMLTGQTVGDAGTASLLCTWDLRSFRWWDDALLAAGISKDTLSTPLNPGALAGPITREGAGWLGVPPGIPFSVGGLDHHVAAIGAGLGQVADFSESIGTVLACLHCTDGYTPVRNCCMGPGVGAHNYYQLAFDGNGASALEWYQKRHAPQRTIAELVAQAHEVPPGCDGLIALPQANQREGLSGFLGRRPEHHDGHYVRAIMESTSATLGQLVKHLCPAAQPERIVATGGGIRSDLWPRIQADMLGIEVLTTNCEEPACRGSAMLASVSCNWFPDVAAAGRVWTTVRKRFSPDPSDHALYDRWMPPFREACASDAT